MPTYCCCSKKIYNSQKTVCCAICSRQFHWTCADVDITSYNNSDGWYSKFCLVDVFQFNHYEDDNEFHCALQFSVTCNLTSSQYDRLNSLVFNPFCFNDGHLNLILTPMLTFIITLLLRANMSVNRIYIIC